MGDPSHKGVAEAALLPVHLCAEGNFHFHLYFLSCNEKIEIPDFHFVPKGLLPSAIPIVQTHIIYLFCILVVLEKEKRHGLTPNQLKQTIKGKYEF